jgi:hypothetical protein
MNKIYIFIISTFLISCETKLPDNIDKATDRVIHMNETFYQKDSLFCSLTKEQIDNLSADSLLSITTSFEISKNLRKDADNELNELLKYNPEYSNHTKIKNRFEKLHIGNCCQKRYSKFLYMIELRHYKSLPKYATKPTWDL